MRCIRLAITQQHIDTGRRHRRDACPIALALQECGYDANVFTHMATLDGQDVKLPPSAISFIKRFDRGLEVRPLSFALWCQPKHR